MSKKITAEQLRKQMAHFGTFPPKLQVDVLASYLNDYFAE